MSELNNTALCPVENPATITLEMAKTRYEVLKWIVETHLVEGEDYGTLPGVPEPYLKKAGAEKLMAMFKLRANPIYKSSHEDWEKGIFSFRYLVELVSPGGVEAGCEAGCTNMEDNFRYRWQDDDPPQEKAEELAMKRAKKGRWIPADPETGQKWQWQIKVDAENRYDAYNKVIKRCQKRGMAGAVLLLFAASGFFAKAGKKIKSESGKKGKEGKSGKKEQDGSTRFWFRRRELGVEGDEVKALALKADAGEMTWDEAIEKLETLKK